MKQPIRKHHLFSRMLCAGTEATLSAERNFPSAREGSGFGMAPDFDLNRDRCPSDPGEVADDYCRNRLSSEEARMFEEHYIVCPHCTEEVARTQQLIEALRQFEARKGAAIRE